MEIQDIQFPEGKETFTTGQVANLLGISPSKVRYWVNTFEIPLSRKNKRRVFTRGDVLTIARIQKLRYDNNLMIEGAKRQLQMDTSSSGFPGAGASILEADPEETETPRQDYSGKPEKPGQPEVAETSEATSRHQVLNSNPREKEQPGPDDNSTPGMDIQVKQLERIHKREKKYIIRELRDILEILDQ